MERNGALETHPAPHKSKEAQERLDSEAQEDEEEDEDEEEKDEEEEEEEVEEEIPEEPVKGNETILFKEPTGICLRRTP